VAVHGASGRLGSLIVAAATHGGDGVAAGTSYAGPVGRDGVIPAGASAVIDVSSAAGTAALIAKLTAAADAAGGKALPLVIGTTGDLPMADIRAYAKRAPVVLSANFSAGVPLVLAMIKAAAGGLPAGWHAEVSEIHHTAKKDAPSGTAKRLVAGLRDAAVQPFVPAGAAAADAAATPIPVHALRLGDTIGEHTVYLAGPGERVEIKHTATRREVFAIGALRTAAWAAAAAEPGLHVK
jgi:4-hydroxy-tetrahydrodipicolinate reductase